MLDFPPLLVAFDLLDLDDLLDFDLLDDFPESCLLLSPPTLLVFDTTLVLEECLRFLALSFLAFSSSNFRFVAADGIRYHERIINDKAHNNYGTK